MSSEVETSLLVGVAEAGFEPGSRGAWSMLLTQCSGLDSVGWTAVLGSHRLPRGLAGDDETCSSPELWLRAPSVEGGSGAEGAAPPAPPMPGAWFLARGSHQSPPASCRPLPSFLSQCVGSGANPSSALICWCDLGRAAPYYCLSFHFQSLPTRAS